MGKSNGSENVRNGSLIAFGDEERVRELELAVTLADTRGDIPAGFEARLELLEAIRGLGRYEAELAYFVWCMNACENDPRLLDQYEESLLWEFSFGVDAGAKQPGVSREQITFAFAAMVRLYDRAGESHREIHRLRAATSCCFGDIKQITFHLDLWLAMEADDMVVDEALECYDATYQYLFTGTVADALRTAGPLMEGRYRNWQQPAACDMLLLPPLFRLGRLEEAERLQRRSYKDARRVDLLEESGFMFAYLGATDQLTRGINLLDAAFSNYLRVRRGWDRMHMLAGVRVLLRRLVQVDRQNLKLRLSPDLDLYRPDNLYAVAPLLAWVERQFDDLTGQFDRRNGNTVVGDRLRGLSKLLEAVRPIAGRTPRGAKQERHER